MARRLLAIAALLVAAAVPDNRVLAGNPSVVTRHLQSGPTYGYHPKYGCQDCQMPWQPIRSVLHYNVLPPGMLRPLPLHIPTPSLAPRTPDFSCGPGTGCGLTPECCWTSWCRPW